MTQDLFTVGVAAGRKGMARRAGRKGNIAPFIWATVLTLAIIGGIVAFAFLA